MRRVRHAHPVGELDRSSPIKIDGVLVLDKPSCVSSNALLQIVKTTLRVQKAGYVGTLDPLATGMLPICLGEATKFARYISDDDKEYTVSAQLGVRTDTFDSCGEVIDARPVQCARSALHRALSSFCGKQQQIPPMFSAKKHRGVRLYRYARRGISIDRRPCSIVVRAIRLVRWKHCSLTLWIRCSKGTYVRSLVDDLGTRLGCGAHVTTLRRTRMSCYDRGQMQSIHGLVHRRRRSVVLPIESTVSRFPGVRLSFRGVDALRSGQSVAVQCPRHGVVRILDDTGRFWGTGEIRRRRVFPQRLLTRTHGGT